MTLEQRQRAQEMARLAAPAATNLEMLAVDVLMTVDGRRSDVGVVPGDDVAAAVADEGEPLFERARRAGRLDHDVDALAMCSRSQILQPLLRGGAIQIVDVVRA